MIKMFVEPLIFTSPAKVAQKACTSKKKSLAPSLLETDSSCLASVNWAWEMLMRKFFLTTRSHGSVVTLPD